MCVNKRLVSILATDVVFKAPVLEKEDFEKFRGKHVAVVSGKVAAAGDTSKEVLEKAMEEDPELEPSEIALYFVPAADKLIL